ncbi:MAG: 16S rRNA processing protein RimM [Nitrospinota bacterium]|nr:MAG: 16S rRNA processing protein RimM [Nitrospinota bacterium]
MAQTFIEIGRIVRPQGNRGAVRVSPRFGEPDFYLALPEVVLQKGEQRIPAVVERCWQHKHFLIFHFQGCDSLEAARQWVGYSVVLPREAFAPLPEGEYYWFEMEGLAVYSEEGSYLGTVAEVVSFGSSDLLVVRQGEEEWFLPMTREIVQQIDLTAQRMVIRLLPGLLGTDGN